MDSYIANDGDRLDSVTYKCYGTLDNFMEVLSANIHLLGVEFLSSGDVVYLPLFTRIENEEVPALWN